MVDAVGYVTRIHACDSARIDGVIGIDRTVIRTMTYRPAVSPCHSACIGGTALQYTIQVQILNHTAVEAEQSVINPRA
jgi:hypothetical protein